MSEDEQFQLTDDDRYAVQIAMNVARRLLGDPQTSPIQVIGLGNALYALERLPAATPGACVEFGVEYRDGTEDFREMRYFNFRVSEFEFEIVRGGSVYDKAVGSDSFSEPGWHIELGGYQNNECELYSLEENVNEYLNPGAKVTVSDESEIEYE